jgi:hypothetical protein
MNEKEIINNTYAIMKGNTVNRLIMLDSHNPDFLENYVLNKEEGEDGYYACKDYGQAFVGGDMWQGKFRPAPEHPALIWNSSYWRWEPPVPRPQETEDTIYWFDLEKWEWVGIPRVAPQPM